MWQTHRHTDTQTDRQTDTQTDRQTDTQTDRQTDRQTHRQTDTQTDHGTVTSLPIGKVACQQCRLKLKQDIKFSCMNNSPQGGGRLERTWLMKNWQDSTQGKYWKSRKASNDTLPVHLGVKRGEVMYVNVTFLWTQQLWEKETGKRQLSQHVLIEHLSSHTDIDRHIDRQADRQIRSGQALNQVGHGLQAHPVAGLLANPRAHSCSDS